MRKIVIYLNLKRKYSEMKRYRCFTEKDTREKQKKNVMQSAPQAERMRSAKAMPNAKNLFIGFSFQNLKKGRMAFFESCLEDFMGFSGRGVICRGRRR